jgi:hypothetical protein
LLALFPRYGPQNPGVPWTVRFTLGILDNTSQELHAQAQASKVREKFGVGGVQSDSKASQDGKTRPAKAPFEEIWKGKQERLKKKALAQIHISQFHSSLGRTVQKKDSIYAPKSTSPKSSFIYPHVFPHFP